MAIPCSDLSEFQDYLRKLRLVDDRINNALNSIVPTESFAAQVDAGKQCHGLYDEIQKHAHQRKLAIKTCINEAQANIDRMKLDKNSDGQSLALSRELRQEQTKIKLLRSELNIDEIVRDRTMKAFHERCRSVFKPPVVDK